MIDEREGELGLPVEADATTAYVEVGNETIQESGGVGGLGGDAARLKTIDALRNNVLKNLLRVVGVEASSIRIPGRKAPKLIPAVDPVWDRLRSFLISEGDRLNDERASKGLRCVADARLSTDKIV